MEHHEVHKQVKDELRQQQSPEMVRRDVYFKSTLVIFIILVIIFIGAIALAAFLVFRQIEQVEVLETQRRPPAPEVYSAATPFPFQELTIPYLRAKNYESSIADLDQISSNGNYTSYLTSYTSDGLRVNGLLTRPAGQMPTGGYPAIVFVHGYLNPATYQTTGQSYSDYVDYLARNGFVVFKIDLRGHGNSEGEAGGAYYSGDYVTDVLSARNALTKLDFVNGDKIGVWGHSMAGNVTFRSFVASQNITAVAIWGGAVFTYDDWQEFGLNDNSYRPPSSNFERQRMREELFATYGEFNSTSDFWKMVIPTNYLEGISGAVQLNHAVNDTVVDIGYSRGLAEILESTNIEYELNEYPSGGHDIEGVAFTQAMQDTVRFFRENL